MEIRWLEDFITLARTRHFSRAAETQNVTQPTFSRRIKLLEEEMGVTLVDRQTLPLTLTPAGEEFLRLCEQITERVRLTRERIGQIAENQARRIVIAAPQSALSYILPGWLDQHRLQQRVEPYLRATVRGYRWMSIPAASNTCPSTPRYWCRSAPPTTADSRASPCPASAASRCRVSPITRAG